MTAKTNKPASAEPAGDKPLSKRGMSPHLVRLGLVLTVLTMLGAGGLWWWLGPKLPQAEERLAEALRHLDAGEIEEARTIAQELEERGFHSTLLPGGVEFVLGMTAFHAAEADKETSGPAWYEVAAVYLKEAGRALPEERRPTWCYALGKSLSMMGDTAGALPLLEEAVDTLAAQRLEASLLLAELLLETHDDNDHEALPRALQLTTQVLAELDSSSELLPAALMLHGEILLAAEQLSEVDTVVQRLTALAGESAARATILKAQQHLAQGQPEEALRRLETLPTHSDSPLDPWLLRRVLFLQGLAAEGSAEQLASTAPSQHATRIEAYRQHARDYFQTLLDRYERSPEGLAAWVHLGRLQQQAGAHEKALQSFTAALQRVDDVRTYRNRWLSLDGFRTRILSAWHDWNQASQFEVAIALAESMSPLMAREQADELAARTRHSWAEAVEEELQRSPATVRAQRTAELRRLWRESGAAFARLAEDRRPIDRPHDLWISADHYFRGHDFVTALKLLDEFLRSPPEAMRPMALVRRGEVLLNLDRLDEALRDLDEVLTHSATSPSAFRAQYLRGVCLLERDDTTGAEQAWRKLLQSPDLSPNALEWREALLATGMLRGELAALERRQARNLDLPQADRNRAWQRVQDLAQDAASLLEEYLMRYPQSPRYPEAQYVLARVLQFHAEDQQRQGEQAETENARQQARSRQQHYLQRAKAQFHDLRDRLSLSAKNETLDAFGRTLLTNAWFDYAALCFQLALYDECIAAYSAAANQYPQDVRVLTAYLQMAQAYALSGRPVEARSMLEQAQVILDQRQIPEAAFQAPTTNLTRTEWNEWLARARHVQH